MIERWRAWARRIKRDTLALYLAYRDPRTPWYARLVAGLVVAYAFSPIDLIPDPIPILGYLDDLVLVPLGILLAIRLVPAVVMAEYRGEAERRLSEARPVSRAAAAVIIGIWLLLGALAIVLIGRWWDGWR